MFGLFKRDTQEIIVVRNAQGHIQHTMYQALSRRAIEGITLRSGMRGINDDGHRYWVLPIDTAVTLNSPDGSSYTIPGGYSITYICD